MYDKRTDTYTEDFLQDINDGEGIQKKIPGINSPQLNSDISIES